MMMKLIRNTRSAITLGAMLLSVIILALYLGFRSSNTIDLREAPIISFITFRFLPTETAADCLIAFEIITLESVDGQNPYGWDAPVLQHVSEYARQIDPESGYLSVANVGFNDHYFLPGGCDRSFEISDAMARFANGLQSKWRYIARTPIEQVTEKYKDVPLATVHGVSKAEFRLRRVADATPCHGQGWRPLGDLINEKIKPPPHEEQVNEATIFWGNLHYALADILDGRPMEDVLEYRFPRKTRELAKAVLTDQIRKSGCETQPNTPKYHPLMFWDTRFRYGQAGVISMTIPVHSFDQSRYLNVYSIN